MKTEPIVINLNIRVDVDNPQQFAVEFAERLMKAMSEPVEAEQDAEWVEWPVGGDRFRIRPDGSAAQWDDGEDWAEEREDIDWVIAYRKGREVKAAERQEELWSKCREITALRAVLASINILMQERGFHPMGAPNYALLFGHVQTYIGQLEAVQAERDNLRQELDLSVKLREAADLCVFLVPIFERLV